jgi:V/A-type H+-transporting ATPase subunit I
VNALERCRQCIDSEAERRERTVNLLDELNVRSRVAALRWLLERHLWLTRTLADARRGERFVWLSGWVPQARLSELSRGLDARGIPFLLNTASPGVHGRPPVQLENPAWVRQFEPFVRGFGVPESDEVDPSPVLAISTPLMFGYMFGDVGHGIVLILLGIWLRRRVPVLGLLVPAGVSSALFGLLFGSVFCDEHVLTPLWTSPLQQPLLILVVPLAFGALLILLSLLFDAMQAFWQDRGEDWWLRRLPVVLAYCGLIAAPLDHRGVALSAVAIVWSIGWETQRGARTSGFPGLLTAPLKAGIELLETLMQLLINTLSFTRLGAFALAHAGLGTAVVILGAMPDNPWFKWAILIAGNVLVVALEGLVVSIQTTRLVMFEFFRRFLLGHGRPFQPLTAPGSAGAARAPRGAPH